MRKKLGRQTGTQSWRMLNIILKSTLSYMCSKEMLTFLSVKVYMLDSFLWQGDYLGSPREREKVRS